MDEVSYLEIVRPGQPQKAPFSAKSYLEIVNEEVDAVVGVETSDES